MASIEQLSYHDKISMIRNRYKSTKDLWLYMTERRKFNLLLQNNFMIPSWLLDAFTQEHEVVIHLRHLIKKKESLES